MRYAIMTTIRTIDAYRLLSFTGSLTRIQCLGSGKFAQASFGKCTTRVIKKTRESQINFPKQPSLVLKCLCICRLLKEYL
jgi:hypothetical protein